MGESPRRNDSRAFLQEFIDEYGFLSFLDMVVVDLVPGEFQLRVSFHQKFTNEDAPDGTVHGDMASTVIDTAGAMCVLTRLDNPLKSDVPTIDLNVPYLRSASAYLLTTASRVRIGGTIGVPGLLAKAKYRRTS